ncbi:hypothetical protein OE88DRAFT_1645563 [Heliocybe sulcata]|uniref:Uncharacterized protein n=1 Tax=Heliocybe sulcata TaxID=5364 RepID=A0A5C3MYE4_9AGAM|nr:hypothetical protein OE88DRAFT_1645563 [Heliocybe sulcata]
MPVCSSRPCSMLELQIDCTCFVMWDHRFRVITILHRYSHSRHRFVGSRLCKAFLIDSLLVYGILVTFRDPPEEAMRRKKYVRLVCLINAWQNGQELYLYKALTVFTLKPDESGLELAITVSAPSDLHVP